MILKQVEFLCITQQPISLDQFDPVRPSATHNTQKVYLEALKRICEWESHRKIDLATRFQKQQFLSSQEIDSLTRHLGERRNGNKHDVIGRGKYNTYVAYAADYIRWLADEVITESSTLCMAIS